MEIKGNQQLAFRDILVNNKKDNSLGRTIYRKKKHMNHYLNIKSSPCPTSKDHEDSGGTITKTSTHRLLKTRYEYIDLALLHYEYSEYIMRALRSRKTQKPQEEKSLYTVPERNHRQNGKRTEETQD